MDGPGYYRKLKFLGGFFFPSPLASSFVQREAALTRIDPIFFSFSLLPVAGQFQWWRERVQALRRINTGRHAALIQGPYGQ